MKYAKKYVILTAATVDALEMAVNTTLAQEGAFREWRDTQPMYGRGWAELVGGVSLAINRDGNILFAQAVMFEYSD